MVYIRAKDLPNLKAYKYSAVDKSLVSKYILKPFYTNVVINMFPMSMAPNAITLSGFGFVVINFLTMLWYNPTMDKDMPTWVYASWAIGLFLYQTFDAVDGSQARRTHQSGPLGELFDHGVDACNTVLEVILFSAAMNLGQGWGAILTLFGSTFTFYVQTWDEYWTETLTLGVVSGPVEGILTLCLVYALTAVLGGGSFWQQSMFESLGLQNNGLIPDTLYKMPWNEWYMVYGALVLVFNTITSASNVVNWDQSKSTHPKPRGSPLKGLLPVVYMWASIVTYLYLNPVILRYHLVPFIFFVGLINAYMVGKMIIAHLLKSPKFPMTNVMVWPLSLAAADSLAGYLGIWPSVLGDSTYQIAFVFAALGFGMGVYGSFVYDIITTICDYLDIWCLTIKHPYVEGKDEKKSR